MARGDSVIRVSIIGDARKLVGALGEADAATGGLLKSAAKVFVGARVVAKGFDVIEGSLAKADDFNDAFDVLAGTIGKIDADKVKDVAFSMSDIGLSADEVGLLASHFASFATAAGVAAPTISALTPELLDIASAVSAQTGKTLDEIVGDIGKAAQGSQKPVSEYGVLIDKALNPDEQLRSILDQLQAKFGTAKTAADDFAGSQDTLAAKWDNVMIKIGDGLDGPLKGVLDFINDEIDAIPGAIQGWQNLGAAIEAFGRTALGPLGNVRDALAGIIELLDQSKSGTATFHVNTTRITDSAIAAANTRDRERNGLGR